MRVALPIAGLLLALCSAGAAEPGMAVIAASNYRPLFRGEKDAK